MRHGVDSPTELEEGDVSPSELIVVVLGYFEPQPVGLGVGEVVDDCREGPHVCYYLVVFPAGVVM